MAFFTVINPAALARKSMKIGCLCVFASFLAIACSSQGSSTSQERTAQVVTDALVEVRPAIYQIQEQLLPRLEGKRVGVVANHTSLVAGVHLVDTLIASGVAVKKVLAPEHGFRGDVPDGAEIDHTIDARTGLPIVSIYGKTKKPTPEMLKDIDVIVFDIQDVGARFYTFISTLHYVMEAAAESDKEVVILDRPNPNIHYVDGPVLEPDFKSFVGMHEIPVVYGMSIGEVGAMINGEGWLKGGIHCRLSVIECLDYTRNSRYQLPVSPSPNLPSMKSIYWYPSICFFEGTDVSVGRGTPEPFTRIGEPTNKNGDFTFTPVSIKNASANPKHENMVCKGYDLSDLIKPENLPDTLSLFWLPKMYAEYGGSEFFRKDGYFDLLAGTDKLRKAIIAKTPINEIRESWQPDIEKFMAVRAKYLLYAE